MEKQHESTSQMEFYNIITEVTSHHLCHVLSVRGKSQFLPTFKGKGIIERCEFWEVRIIGATLKSDIPSEVLNSTMIRKVTLRGYKAITPSEAGFLLLPTL